MIAKVRGDGEVGKVMVGPGGGDVECTASVHTFIFADKLSIVVMFWAASFMATPLIVAVNIPKNAASAIRAMTRPSTVEPYDLLVN